MHIGLLVPDPPPGPDPLGDLIQVVAQAADDGLDSVWMSHVFGLDALTALAVAGRAVPRIELGTGVVPIYPRHPAALAQQALTTQAAVGGRLSLGIGLSHQIVVESMYGYSFERPLRHMAEHLDVLLPLLDEGTVSFNGDTVQAHLGLQTPRPHRVPVLLAALAPGMLRLAGARTDGTVLWMTGPATIAGSIAPTMGAAAEEAGRPQPRIVCALPTCVTDDPAAARQRASAAFAIYGQLPSYRAVLDQEGATGPGDVAVVGDESAVREQIEVLAGVGVTDFVAAEYGAGDEQTRTRALLRSLTTTAVTSDV
jgi:F420-dependent oxidoreductase-like protein